MKFTSTLTAAALVLGASQAIPNPKASSDTTVISRRSVSAVSSRQVVPEFQIRTRAVENVLFKRVKGGDHVDSSGRVVKEPATFNGPHSKDEVKKLAEKLQADPSKAMKETLDLVNKRPRGKDANGKTIKVELEIQGKSFERGETGILIVEDPKTGEHVVFIGYGDGMTFHADHELALSERYGDMLSHGYRLRSTPFSRDQTLKGLDGDGPLHRDENPIRQFDALEGLHSVMDVPSGESSMQGTMAQAAKTFVAKHGGVIRPFDNRSDAKLKEVRGRIVRGAAGDNNGRGEPQVESVEYKTADVIARMTPISRDIMPQALRERIGEIEADNGKGKGKGKAKRSLAKRDFDNDAVITFSPFYNDAMTGADKFNPDSVKPFNDPSSFFLGLYPELTGPANTTKRDIIGDISGQEQNATDVGQDDDKNFIQQLILAKEIAQNNLTATLMPYIDAVMNGSSHPMAESIAWNLYSIVLPDISVASPFDGPFDALTDMYANSTNSNKEWAQSVSAFNNFVWGRAWTACNATGLLGPLYTLNAELSSYNQSVWPEEAWTVDDHVQEPFLDYLQQWFAYNEMPWTKSNGSDHVITPDWVLQELNLSNLNDTLTVNGTDMTINGTTYDLSQNVNSTSFVVPSNTTHSRRWHA